jgi:tRNA-modifying protein YgfZ
MSGFSMALSLNLIADPAAFAPAPAGDFATEYAAATTTAALFDRSAVAKLRLTGPDAPAFLGNLSTNDIKSLPLGGGCETYFCDSRGKALFQAWVYHIRTGDGRHALWLETTPGRNAVLLQHLDRYLISEAVEFEDVTERFAQMHLAGPTAKAVLEAALGSAVPDLAEFLHMERTFGATSTCSIRRRDPLGVPGYDLVCLPDRAAGVWRMLCASGATAASPATFEALRIEAGTPVYGPDIDETRFVMEVGKVERAVSYSKGCYLGQEPIVMSRDRAGHAPRSFVRLKAESGHPLPVGVKLFAGPDEAGVVTSATVTPRSGSVALGYVRWKHRDTGTKLDADTPSGKVACETVG